MLCWGALQPVPTAGRSSCGTATRRYYNMNSTMQETISVIDQGYLNDNRQHVKRMVRSYLDKNGLSHSQFRRTMVAIENAAKQRNGCLVWVNDSGYVLGVVVNDM